MADQSVHVPLLSGKKVGKKIPLLIICSTKWVLKISMWVIFIFWVMYLFLTPAKFTNDFFDKWSAATSVSLYGLTGSFFLIYCAPILLIACLAVIYLIISGEGEIQQEYIPKRASFHLWTFPIIIDGPLGVVSAAELIGIVLFAVFVIWFISAFLVQDSSLIFSYDSSFKDKSLLILEATGLRLGRLGSYCLAFLFLPVSRGSVLLRLIDIPFEHATKYHVWLGHLTMLIFTLHALCFTIEWTWNSNLLHKLTNWKDFGVANFPGVISLSAGLLMWMTSLRPVRRTNFELFFYTHQLYVVFVIFLALHVGDFLLTMAASGIFLFMVDRFLRFCQCRRTVDVLSAKCLPCGTVELVLSKPASLSYNALGWVFIRIQELSLLQWHPFSVSSSPLDGKSHIAVLIKVLGNWTEKLRGHIVNDTEKTEKEQLLKPHSRFTASVEGPYGHESPYHLLYENLILVAGGIGISPFLAILNDILHRINEYRSCLPRKILIVWAVKTSEELPLLHSVDLESICPRFSDKLDLEIQTYVTRESEPPSLEEGEVHFKSMTSSVFPASTGSAMSTLVGTGNIIWSGIYVVVCIIGLVITVGLLDIFYINPFNITSWWYKGLLLMASMVTSVLVFGGLVIVLWNIWDRQFSGKKEAEYNDKTKIFQSHGHDTAKDYHKQPVNNTIRYGQRPDFKEIFGSKSKRWGNVNVGVIVCGPPTLQTSIARECRRRNFGRRNNHPVFHFNSHSFDL